MCDVSGDIPEEAYYQQQKVQLDLLDLFRMVDQAANGVLTGSLPRREIRVLLKGKMPITHKRAERQHRAPLWCQPYVCCLTACYGSMGLVGWREECLSSLCLECCSVFALTASIGWTT